ncbi:hypothetical protein FSP39_007886 [Pinctada imbricata]|uniref:AMP-dependent synthetase/ligase domain-containing protein n=1 Tax=Pinctada imbricata TaxID=66713 RepID=A0AA89BT85_PINIB|nr:hypothetical protein FSP39_007886 [Pinctada imbricata]
MCTMKKRSYLYTPWAGNMPYCTIPEKLKLYAEEVPNKEALVFVGENGREGVTYAEIVTKSEEIARQLIKLGIKQNDIVAVHDDKSPIWLYCTLGVQMCGAWPFHFYFQKNDGSDVAAMLQKMSCTALITHPGEKNSYVSIIKHFATFKPDGMVDSKSVPSLRNILFTSHTCDFDGALFIQNIPFSTDDTLPNIEPEDIAAIFYSSGSTGPPKLISWSHASLLLYNSIGCEGMSYKKYDSLFCDRTFGWIAGYPGLIFDGITRVTTSTSFKEKTLSDICSSTAKIINQEDCTHAILFSSTMNELMNGDYKMKTLETILSGDGPISSRDSKMLGKFCRKFMNTYGSTENGGMTVNVVTDVTKMKSYDTGVPLPGVEVKVVNKDGRLSEIGTSGEIYIRSKVSSTGYLNEEQEWHKENRLKGYWHKTEDCGYISEDGHLFVTGRMSESIIIEGAIFLPSQYEDIFKQNPCVEDAVAFGIPDEILYHVAGVAIKPKEGMTTTAEDLLTFFRKKRDLNFDDSFYASKFVPKKVLFFEKFPLANSGKVARKLVKEKALEMIRSEGCKF